MRGWRMKCNIASPPQKCIPNRIFLQKSAFFYKNLLLFAGKGSIIASNFIFLYDVCRKLRDSQPKE